MSEYKRKIFLGIVLAVIIAVGLSAATFMIANNSGTTSSQQSTSNSSAISAQSDLIVQLTDPPVVPDGTSSVNLTYSSLDLLVAEPNLVVTTVTSTSSGDTTTSTITTTSTSSQNNVATTKTITLTPSGGSATVDLLKLENISQTLASANLPYGSTIYSVSFTVSSISVDVNGLISPVALATGGNTLLVTLANPAVLEGTDALLLDLTPTVIATPSGYQMIPSATGILKLQSEISYNDHNVGNTDQLSDQDQNDLHNAKGQLSANLIDLSVTGTSTTATVQVKNTGGWDVQLVAIGLQGDFASLGCASTTSTTTSASTSTTTATSTTISEYHGDSNGNYKQHGCDSSEGIVFIPAASTTSTAEYYSSTTSTSTSTSTVTVTATASTSTSCTSVPVDVVNYGHGGEDGFGNGDHQISLAPGQCVNLTYQGTLSFGNSGNVLIPLTVSGGIYIVHVIASHSTEMKIQCTLPLTSSSCSPVSDQH